MPNDPKPVPEAANDGIAHADEPIPRASDEEVLEETARLAREGRKQLESDPREPKPASE
ncbi:hypothetical protein [Ramlibacter henchirensis]|jgi:hypothetical protein|uniref:hypothetical protein n=1 Tax=Ramlibacter henchirensis TaxID=204072 RepID=UPI001430C59D|nr:hypothetical protein [Ramlibacter henchirensis]